MLSLLQICWILLVKFNRALTITIGTLNATQFTRVNRLNIGSIWLLNRTSWSTSICATLPQTINTLALNRCKWAIPTFFASATDHDRAMLLESDMAHCTYKKTRPCHCHQIESKQNGCSQYNTDFSVVCVSQLIQRPLTCR